MPLLALHLFAWNAKTEAKLVALALLAFLGIVVWKNRAIEKALDNEIKHDTLGLIDLTPRQKAATVIVVVVKSPYLFTAGAKRLQPMPCFNMLRVA